MKKVIPFTKEIPFKSKISEITTISLDHDLEFSQDALNGNFYVSGKYKMTEASQIENDFSYKIPFEITISDRYDFDDASADIEDFYYEVIDEEILKVNIEVYIDGLEEKEEVRCYDDEDEDVDEVEDELEKETDLEIAKLISHKETFKELDDEMLFDDEIKEKRPNDDAIVKFEDIMTNVNSNNSEDTYLTYNVYIFREDDTIDNILEKYQITKEQLMEYNSLDDIKPGAKLVIPAAMSNE